MSVFKLFRSQCITLYSVYSIHRCGSETVAEEFKGLALAVSAVRHTKSMKIWVNLKNENVLIYTDKKKAKLALIKQNMPKLKFCTALLLTLFLTLFYYNHRVYKIM